MKSADIIIIGSGLGGLVCAQLLSKHGYKVLVLEKNEQFGGALQIYKRAGATLDTGVHYIGGLQKGQNLYQYFKYLGLMDKLNIHQLDTDGFDCITFDGDKNEYKLAQGYDNFVEQLCVHFPKERAGLQTYIAKIQEVCASVELYNIQNPKLDSFYTPYHLIDTQEYIQSIIQDKKLVSILVGNNLLYAGAPNKTPLYVHALITNSYIQSSWRCTDGGNQIANILVRNIRANGGVVLRNKEVRAITLSNNRVSSVTCTDGEVYTCEHLISNATPLYTYNLLSEEVLRKNVKTKYDQQENSIGAFTFHAILEKETLPYFNYNRYHFRNENTWVNHQYNADKWSENLMIFTPKSTGENIISAMTIMDYSEVEKWKDSINIVPNSTSRGEAYEAWKDAKATIIENKLIELYPEIENKILHIDSSTPLSYRDYLNTKNGSMYGYIKSIHEPYNAYIPSVSKVPNMHFTGQDINLHGILGVTLSAFLTCIPFVDIDNVLSEVRGM
jgi:all-trans-retinol 13,14-reductase